MGAPQAGALISLDDDRGGRIHVYTGTDGFYRLECLPPGAYELYVSFNLEENGEFRPPGFSR